MISVFISLLSWLSLEITSNIQMNLILANSQNFCVHGRLQNTSLEEYHPFPVSPLPRPLVLWTNHKAFCAALFITSLLNGLAIYLYSFHHRLKQLYCVFLSHPRMIYWADLCLSGYFQVTEKWLFLGITKFSLGAGWCSSVDWVQACEPKSCQFDSQSGHIHGFLGQVSSRGRMRSNHTLIFLSLFSSLPSPLSIKINKILKIF